ncbi:MAG: DEAD/DEAH box helicase [Rhodospirillaceae bacterium]|jgi:superfamily II DNA/RNA helicase|nr:DEAD/DEAH box helicase [Rhodospirillaceae bacterium]MBT4688542.1 DEAD/DEAH box helicase [Rhodospirillaceae bacterium]MBT5082275.1 DEAD/DEAH box helicase [Rhodospirillaceae bacterium]MBT5526794.1 DEAD/DEAH box helicase [Rhodospirillaceae bacterium]MBT5879159.1 DEAD/DEAH box helicase [Rhodospirillaceae bacterium]
MPFEELGLSTSILKAVGEAGYSEPTPIQRRAIPYVLQGRDVLGCAQTGTGKTASFTLPMIDILSQGRARARMPRSLILEPTRELAAQVAENFEVYGKHHKLNMALLIGGVSFVDQSRIIDRGADVLIATPGRLLDHFERGGLLLRGVDVLVIDEADRMLDMGFIPDVERIVQLCNPKRQTLFFSATMPREIRRLADVFLNDPTEISVAPPASPAETVDQTLTMVSSREKDRVLQSLLKSQPVKNALIFCNRKRDVDAVAKSLKSKGFDALALHGDMQQTYRMQTLEKFKKNEVKILVCSDVAARGLDIQGLSHVILYDLPIHADDYVHRIGRTGRAGMPGRALTLATKEDGKYLAAIEKLIGKPIPRFEVGDQESDRNQGADAAAEMTPEESVEETVAEIPEIAKTPETPETPEIVVEANIETKPAEVVAEATPEVAIAEEEAAVTEQTEATATATATATGDEEPKQESRPARSRSRGRGRGRGRGGRSRNDSGGEGDTATGGSEASPSNPSNENAGEPKRDGGRGRGQRPARGRSGGQSEGGRSDSGRGRGRGGRSANSAGGRGSNRDNGNDGSTPVVGLGDHMPAFLTRGTGRKKKTDK